MQEAFSFAAPAEVLDGIKLCSGHIYGGLLARLDGVEATKLMNCWCTSVKDVWGVSRDNHRSFARWLVNGNTTIQRGFRIQVNCCLPSMRSVFSGVIDPKPNLNCENESFLEKNLIFRVLLTKPISLLRIA